MKKKDVPTFKVPFNFYEKKEQEGWRKILADLNNIRFEQHLRAIKG